MKAVIFDIDGTIANIDHRVSFAENKQWDEFHSLLLGDPPNLPVVELINYYSFMRDTDIYIMTGRPRQYESETSSWLGKYNIDQHRLYMRPDGDKRSDVDLKRKWLGEIRKQNINIIAAFEDRQSVVDMWRSEGVFCFQCSKGDF